MDKEQIIALAEKADETATQYLQCAGEYHPDYHSVRDEHFYQAAIESYKADLLKGVGKPVLYAEFAEDGGWLGAASECADHLEEPHALFTSYQVAAAIIKATKPLEERRCEICGYAEHHREHTSCLRIQLAKAEQLLQVAQGRCDGLEEKLAKAEQGAMEWQPIETAPKDRTVFLAWRKHATHPLMVRYEPSYDWFANYDGEHVYDLTHWMPLPKAPNGASS